MYVQDILLPWDNDMLVHILIYTGATRIIVYMSIVHVLICTLKGAPPQTLFFFIQTLGYQNMRLLLLQYLWIILMMFIFVPNNEHYNINL